ncbi:hypothetical protein VVATL9824_00183 [Vibrio vulnificus]|nr:hypothetical protein VVATL9824_00183 [Vibrio vulnificus]
MTLTIANKIRLGFAICLLFFIVASYVSYQGMVNAASNFRHYGELAGETTLAGTQHSPFPIAFYRCLLRELSRDGQCGEQLPSLR